MLGTVMALGGRWVPPDSRVQLVSCTSLQSLQVRLQSRLQRQHVRADQCACTPLLAPSLVPRTTAHAPSYLKHRSVASVADELLVPHLGLECGGAAGRTVQKGVWVVCSVCLLHVPEAPGRCSPWKAVYSTAHLHLARRCNCRGRCVKTSTGTHWGPTPMRAIQRWSHGAPGPAPRRLPHLHLVRDVGPIEGALHQDGAAQPQHVGDVTAHLGGAGGLGGG